MKASELRSKKAEDLDNMLIELKEEHFRLRFQHATGQLENHRRLRQIKKEIARLHTVMNERGNEKAVVETTNE